MASKVAKKVEVKLEGNTKSFDTVIVKSSEELTDHEFKNLARNMMLLYETCDGHKIGHGWANLELMVECVVANSISGGSLRAMERMLIDMTPEIETASEIVRIFEHQRKVPIAVCTHTHTHTHNTQHSHTITGF